MAAVRVDRTRQPLPCVASRAPARRRVSLFCRLLVAYVGVVALAVSVLVFAPVWVSAANALTEVAVLLTGFSIALIYCALLRRALSPLERLTPDRSARAWRRLIRY